MEYCERKSLRQVINDTTIVYNQKTMICWAEHLFRALQCLQENHIVHRDLKPENVLVTGDFILKFCDFGCVRELNNTGTVTMIGTYRYMSPEMATKSWFTHQSDVYSIGLVLWEISEREVVYAEYGVRQFDHFTFFPDFQLGNVQLPSPHCDETLKQMILDCTVFDHTARPAIHKCLTQIDDLQKRYVDLDFSPLISPNRKCLLRLDQTTIADNNSQSSDIPFLSSIESPDESPSTEFEHKNESDFNRILRRSHEISDKLKKATVMPITKLMRENRLSHGGLRALRKKLDEDIIDMPVSDPLCEHRDFLQKTVFDYEFTFDSLPLFPEPVNENFLKFLLKSGLDTEVIEDLMTESITWYLLRIDDFKKYRATLIKCFRALSDFYETNDAELFREQIAAFQTAFKRNPWSGDIADSPTHLRLVVYKNEKTVPDAWYLLSRKESLFVRCDYSEFRKFSPFLESSKNLDNISFFDVESPNDPLRKVENRSFKYEQIDDENLARITVDRLLFVVEEFIGFMEKLVRRIDEAEENGFDPQKKLWESKADYPSILQQRFCREVFPKIAA
ncbi:unnamed protein product, partial [Mesorhabditis belari]|uniref:Protein kinase domain-containing protein n=1 Tax=Mesorhabditis belari TaxID=2138241 RepID=A0AAF3FF00_9BILA